MVKELAGNHAVLSPVAKTDSGPVLAVRLFDLTVASKPSTKNVIQ